MRLSMMASTIREILTFKVKDRYDDVTDHFTRIFMPKVFIISAIVTGLNYFYDKVHCIVSEKSVLSMEYVQSICWITGFFIYDEMHTKITDSAYYGIPKNMDYDGITKQGKRTIGFTGFAELPNLNYSIENQPLDEKRTEYYQNVK